MTVTGTKIDDGQTAADELVVVIECEGSDRETLAYDPERREGSWLERVKEMAAERGVAESDVNIRFTRASTGRAQER